MRVASIAIAFFLAAEAAVRAGTEHPSWSLSAEAKQKLARNASKLRAGHSYDTVIAALGKPTYNQRMVAKESNRLIGRSLKYYAVRWDAGLVNERKDQFVSIWLDTDNRVREVSIRITPSQ